MPRYTTISVLIIFLTIISCTGNKYADNATIQKDINDAVNLYQSDSWEIRLEALKKINSHSGTVYARNSFHFILAATDDPYSEIRIEALKILKLIKSPEAEEKIRKIALDDTNSNVKYYAFSALEEYGDIKNEESFLHGLNDDDWLVRESALKGLMKINYPDIQKKHIPIIVKAINDKNISIRITAISNLSVKDPLLYDTLSGIINDKESGSTILKAALQGIKGYKLDEMTKKRIIELLIHKDPQVRTMSLQVLKYKE